MSDPLRPTTDYLSRPLRSRERAALDLAVNALREIADEATTMGPEHTAQAALETIGTLVPEAVRKPE